MLKITDKLEDKEILVTRGAYENLYKGLGYKIVGDKKEAVVEKAPAPKEPAVEENKPEEIIIEEKHENDDEKLMDNILNKKYNRKKN